MSLSHKYLDVGRSLNLLETCTLVNLRVTLPLKVKIKVKLIMVGDNMGATQHFLKNDFAQHQDILFHIYYSYFASFRKSYIH